MLETWVAPTAGRIAVSWELPERVQYALESQTLAAELQMENALGTFAQVRPRRRAPSSCCAGSDGMTEAEARAIVLAGEARRRDVERLWERLTGAILSPRARHVPPEALITGLVPVPSANKSVLRVGENPPS